MKEVGQSKAKGKEKGTEEMLLDMFRDNIAFILDHMQGIFQIKVKFLILWSRENVRHRDK